MKRAVFVQWPDAPLTESLVRRSLSRLYPDSLDFVSKPECRTDELLLQWSTYDIIDHEITLLNPSSALSSSYIIRKALIRKHFLHRCIHSYITKYPNSILSSSVPRTWDLEISFADELDELWADELWDLSEELDSNSTGKWWILKPGMADRGMGIRLFNSKESLQDIFESFEGDSDAEGDSSDEPEDDDTNVVTSQLRHFVIQEYLQNPVLMDPNQIPVVPDSPSPPPSELEGYKFHIRAYCVASGNLSVYLYDRVLALFSSEPFKIPSDASESPQDLDLRPHLTNTCLQQHRREQGVRLLSELIGCTILSDETHKTTLTAENVNDVLSQIADVLAETFRAAVQFPVHFQPLPNAFELFGVDFLVTHRLMNGSAEEPSTQKSRFQVNILEVNSEPAIEMTGPRLKWVLEDLFDHIANFAVLPFFKRSRDAPSENTLDVKFNDSHWRKCVVIASGR